MLITRTSPITGEATTLDINVSTELFETYLEGGTSVPNIQDLMVGLTGAEREFIMTGITAADWNRCISEVEIDTQLIPLDDLDFTVRTMNALKSIHVTTLGELASCKTSQLLQVKNFSKTVLTEVVELLTAYDLNLAPE